MTTDGGRNGIGLCGEFCQPCVYRSINHNSCDYILITGHPRGCPAGEGCTRREVGHRKRDTAPKVRHRNDYIPKIGQAEHQRRLTLYKQGLSDGKIADLLGVSSTAVRMWRKAYSLPVNRHGQAFAERLELYHAGKTDKEIADALGLNVSTIRSWRQMRGLPANAAPKPEKPDKISASHPYGKEDEARRMELYQQGLSDSEIANASGFSAQVIRKWRSRRGLKANRPDHGGGRPVPEDEERRRMELWGQGLSDMAIARELGVCCGTVIKWRRRRNLPQNKPQKRQQPPNLLPEAQDQRRMELYQQGLSDSEIAKAVGVEPQVVQKWRSRRGLKANRPDHGGGRPVSEDEERRRMELWR